MTTQLTLRSSTALGWRRWADDFVVFNDASGQTHQLDGLTATALMAIEEGPRSIDALSQLLGTEFALDTEQLASTIPMVIEQLKSAGLIDIIAG